MRWITLRRTEFPKGQEKYTIVQLRLWKLQLVSTSHWRRLVLTSMNFTRLSNLFIGQPIASFLKSHVIRQELLYFYHSKSKLNNSRPDRIWCPCSGYLYNERDKVKWRLVYLSGCKEDCTNIQGIKSISWTQSQTNSRVSGFKFSQAPPSEFLLFYRDGGKHRIVWIEITHKLGVNIQVVSIIDSKSKGVKELLVTSKLKDTLIFSLTRGLWEEILIIALNPIVVFINGN